MLNIGPGEVVVIALVLLIAVGPEQLPGLIRRIGQSVSQVRGMTESLRSEFMSGLDEIERVADPNAWAASAGPSHVAPRTSPPVDQADDDDPADDSEDGDTEDDDRTDSDPTDRDPSGSDPIDRDPNDSDPTDRDPTDDDVFEAEPADDRPPEADAAGGGLGETAATEGDGGQAPPAVPRRTRAEAEPRPAPSGEPTTGTWSLIETPIDGLAPPATVDGAPAPGTAATNSTVDPVGNGAPDRSAANRSDALAAGPGPGEASPTDPGAGRGTGAPAGPVPADGPAPVDGPVPADGNGKSRSEGSA